MLSGLVTVASSHQSFVSLYSILVGQGFLAILSVAYHETSIRKDYYRLIQNIKKNWKLHTVELPEHKFAQWKKIHAKNLEHLQLDMANLAPQTPADASGRTAGTD